MFAIIDFVLDILGGIIDILNTSFFPDINITFLQVILVSILIKYIIKFLFGGFKEVDTGANFSSKGIIVNKINNNNRKRMIVFDSGIPIHTTHGNYVLDPNTGRLFKRGG